MRPLFTSVLTTTCCLFFVFGCSGGGGTPAADPGQDLQEVAFEVLHEIVFDMPADREAIEEVCGEACATDIEDVEAEVSRPGEFGWPCDDPTDCFSGFCIETMDGYRCSKLCASEESCPKGWKCVKMGDIDPQYVCVDPFLKLCQPCREDQDCKDPNSLNKNLCIEQGPEGRFCGAECVTSEGCPEGYSCVDVGVGGYIVKQCRPKGGGKCECTQKHIAGGYKTICYVEEDLGGEIGLRRCYGERTCDTACNAKVPKIEECNLEDDDCNGKVDDNVPSKPCPLTSGQYTCMGKTICLAGNEVCQGAYPTDEVCNGKDDNCDGVTDEGYPDQDGDGIADCVDCDIDGDGVPNPNPGYCQTPSKPDNCPTVANADQLDMDGDKVGDACDCDIDGDEIPNDNPGCPFPSPKDNCPMLFNPDQKDTDSDGKGDACDCDIDGDGVPNNNPGCPVVQKPDNCPYVKNPGQEDTNGNGQGDACDCDADGDGVPNLNPGCPSVSKPDNCPFVANQDQSDIDGDNVGDACDCDIDGDGVFNNNPGCTEVTKPDNCPFIVNPSQDDSDEDGEGDACDCDIDGDGVANKNPGCPSCDPKCDNCPYTWNPDQANTTGSPYGDACNDDYDNDKIPNADDNCPLKPNQDQADIDFDGIGDVCDCDADGDGIFNDGVSQDGSECPTPQPKDNCPYVSNPDQADLDLDNIGDACDCDIDGDGDPNANPGCKTPAIVDCQPMNPNVFHGQHEVCNGIDDDCDGKTDTEDADAIVAGYFVWDQPKCGNQNGVCAGSKRPAYLCSNGTWLDCGTSEYSAFAGPLYLPSGDTLCDDKDNDCDGETDEDVVLVQADGSVVIGVGKVCGVGACYGALTVCKADKTGMWCPGVVLATKEKCDGIDNDCDGKTDAADTDSIIGGYFEEDAPPCGLTQGVCAGSKRPAYLCVNGKWNPCTAAVYSAWSSYYDDGVEKRCDGLDNDCDGMTDEDFSLTLLDGTVVSGVDVPCGTGRCAGGLTACRTDKKGIQCPTELKAQDEKCNGIDDDCDGKTDADDTDDIDAQGYFIADQPACDIQFGVCLGAKRVAALCQGGTWQPCTDAIYQAHSQFYDPGKKEVRCDGLDNDCDALVDEDLGTETCGLGICLHTIQKCVGGVWQTCNPYQGATTEVCNGKDDDCDGEVDEGLGTITCGKGACLHTVPACVAGVQQTCNPMEGATPEICNGIDDDCDGLTDAADYDSQLNGYFLADQPKCSNQKGVCLNSRRRAEHCVNGTWQDCDELDYSLNSIWYQSGQETSCDNRDNDCDGLTDEGITQPCYTGPSGTLGVGVCRAGTQACIAGMWGTCEGQVLPSPEICNGLDDDCDWLVDADDENSLSNGYFPYDRPLCDVQIGVCQGARRKAIHCVNGQWQACTSLDYAANSPYYEINETTCDNKDNDCDGETDENITRECYFGPGNTKNVGICKPGTQACIAGVWSGSCVGQVLPTVESCNGLDDDCDGLTDAADYADPANSYFPLDRPLCPNQIGVCSGSRKTVSLCVNGSWGPCTAATYQAWATANGKTYQTPAETLCDNQDNDCDNMVDEYITRPCYDGPPATRGVGTCKDGIQTCTAGVWGECVGQVLPVDEICNNADDNCNGVKDEYVVAACYTGDPSTRNVGECRDGTKTCSAGTWGPCTGEVKPVFETCNNKDDDCDGLTDENVTSTCYEGPPGTNGVGICRGGTTTCTAGVFGPCIGQVLPMYESCNNIDDDCDGKTDAQDFDNPSVSFFPSDQPLCENQTGVCTGARKTADLCQSGVWTPCGTLRYTAWANANGRTYQFGTETICDAQDNDCDGLTDENLGTITCGTGPCQYTIPRCINGIIQQCDPYSGATPEICNGIDDDCDGLTDAMDMDSQQNGYFIADQPLCSNQKGVCQGSKRKAVLCVGGTWQDCTTSDYAQYSPNYQPSNETLCDGLDNNCDGITDGMTRSCYTGPPGTRNVGVCRDGVQTCTAGVWGECVGEVLPSPESCNGLDDDCDGTTDAADFTNPSTSFFPNDQPYCEKQLGVCGGAKKTANLCVSGQWTPCDNARYIAWATANGNTYQTSETLCDNKDNDCDGQIDENITQSCYTGPPNTNGVGRCHGGTQTCNAGVWGVCTGEVLPGTETCNNIDDDCDGSIDEGLTQSCYTGPAGTNGVGPCHGGVSTCSAGTWGPCVGEVVPTIETCNNVDDNCNGMTDENVTQSCYTGPPGTSGVGQCRSGTQACTAGTWGPCNGQVLPGVESCNGIDDDCDGKTDAGDFDDPTNSYFPNDQPYCENQDGVCAGSKKTANLCVSGKWTPCNTARYQKIPNYQQHPESLCDGLDNDCDGAVDEDPTYMQLNGVVVTGIGKPCGVGRCIGGTTACNSSKQLYCPTEVFPGPVQETCDGTDQDCDGVVDDGGDAWCTSMKPPDFHGTTVCSNGACVLGQCDQTWFDVNGLYVDGCECRQDDYDIQGKGSSCSNAVEIIASLPDSGTSASITGNIVPVDEEDWFKFKAEDLVQSGTWANHTQEKWSPKVWLDSTSNECIRFKVYTDCPATTQPSCSTGNQNDLRTYTSLSSGQNECVIWSQWNCSPGTACCQSTGPTPCGESVHGVSYCNSSDGISDPLKTKYYYIKVYRLSTGGCAATPTCPGTAYKLWVSNGLL